MKPVKIAYEVFSSKMEKSIRFELVVAFAICFFIAFTSYGIINRKLSIVTRNQYINYSYDHDEDYYRRIMMRVVQEKTNVSDKKEMDNFLTSYNLRNTSLVICDADGKISYKTKDIAYDTVDLQQTFSNGAEYSNDNKKRQYIYPAKLSDKNMFIIFEVKAESRMESQDVREDSSFVALLLSVAIFVFAFIRITNNKMKYIHEISTGVRIIAEGNLEHRIDTKGKDELKNLAQNINHMADEINDRIQQERLLEKNKNELITNVSHDLRTPLTSVMGYLGLVKEKKYNNEEQKNEYLDIAFSKAERLKILIEDLFEYTKLTNRGIKLNFQEVNVVEFLSQITEEMIPLFEEKGLKVEQTYHKSKIILSLDTDKMLRVFENLLMNAIKYSYNESEVKVSLWTADGDVFISVKNRGDHIDSERLSKLFDRFYRTDESRNASTGGSGLGLAISKNIVTMHKGSIWAESLGNNITIIIRIPIKVV